MPTPSARFRLISGNRLDALAAHLGARLATPVDPSDPDSLAPDVVLIPQPGLRHWLLQTLAERRGIAANLDLCTPSEFVWRLLRAAHPALPESSPWDREHLRWRLYALLGESAALPPAVHRHLRRAARTSDAADAALARHALADALAAAYDRYQAYRRDWLEAWEADPPVDRDDWQAQLWRALRRRAPAALPRSALLGDWLARHDRETAGFADAPPPGLPPRLFAFGTLHVSPDVLHLLAVLGQWIPVDFHLPTPCAEYWGDVESLRERLRRDGIGALPAALAEADRDNPLLAAWGAGGREIVARLFSYDIVLPEREVELFLPPGRDSLLHRLQQDVLDRAAPVSSPIDPQDRSLQLHACHSRLREVEVLHDQLRALLDDPRFDPPLQPHEIAVMAPDIADYLPLARAVFGGLDPGDPRHIPYSLADRPQRQTHALIALLPDLLALADTPPTAAGFRDLLALPSLAQALPLDAAQRAKLDDWIAAAGIRWGEDEAARERAGAGRWREYSFEFGFDRLLAGYAAGDDALRAVPGAHDAIAPFAELEGADAEALDRALRVYRELRALAEWMRTPHPATAWRLRLAETLRALLAPVPIDEAEAQARRILFDALDAFAEQAIDAGELPAALVRHALEDALAQPATQRPWLSGGVVFAGMVPLRTVPFRVICLLGLDAEAYPRREPGSDVDRLVDAIQGRAPRRLGDRSVRDDDRFLFLQLLCAAGDVFYLSYGGRDARDGSLREPSPVIGELLDAVERMHGEAAREALSVPHPLQPFSPRAFGAGDDPAAPRRFSYRGEWRMTAQGPAAVATFAAVPLPPGEVADDIPDRDALQAFFANPAKHWLRTRLGLRLPGDTEDIDTREPMGGDGLQRYRAVEALLDADEAEVADPVRALRARALLPPGRDGIALAADAEAVAARLRSARARMQGAAAPAIVAGDGRDSAGIAFRFDDVRDDGRCVVVAGGLDGKRWLRALIDHSLLVTALGERARTHFIFDDKHPERAAELILAGAAPEMARAWLRQMVALWHEGQAAPLPFMPKSAQAYAATLGRTSGDAQAAWKEAWKFHAPFGRSGERDDPWLRLAFRPHGLLERYDSAQARRFREIATIVFSRDGVEP
jgi:exodeoxyribonuclease V gamma subunit